MREASEPENQPIKHHYLPVFYMERWTGTDGRLFRYHRPYRDVVVSPLTPEYTAFEEGLYSLNGAPPEHKQAIETQFMAAVVDNPAAPVIAKMLGGGIGQLSGVERERFARFAMSLTLRNPHALKEVAEMTAATLRANLDRLYDPEYQAAKKAGDPATLYDWAWKNAPDYMANSYKRMLPGFIDHAGIGQKLVNMRWGVMDLSQSRHSLLTSDRPVYRTHGLLEPRCICAVPLSPSHLFIAGNGMTQLRQLDGQRKQDTVRNMNHLLVKMAVENVYGDTTRHLPFVEARLRHKDDPIQPHINLEPRGAGEFRPGSASGE